MKNLIAKIFKFSKRKEWNENHILNWKKSLELNDSGFSIFQKELVSKLESVLEDCKILCETKITEHSDLNNENRIIKIITLTSDQNFKFWIYPDMAEFEVKKQHKIYEKWGYLKPECLINEYIKLIRKLLKTEK